MLISSGEYRHQQDQATKRTRLILVLRGHIIRTWPWVNGILTRKQIMAQSLIVQQANKTAPIMQPCCLKIGS